jgi:hypothetical protein
VCYYYGTGVPKDEVEAVRLYSLAVDQGNASAQFILGRRYAQGGGVPKDEVEAVRLYRLAVDQGNASAQFILGLCLDNGTGVPKDEVEAVRLYRLAVGQGYASAQFALGVCYYYGTGVPKDEVEAVRLYHLAANQGHELAMRFVQSGGPADDDGVGGLCDALDQVRVETPSTAVVAASQRVIPAIPTAPDAFPAARPHVEIGGAVRGSGAAAASAQGNRSYFGIGVSASSLIHDRDANFSSDGSHVFSPESHGQTASPRFSGFAAASGPARAPGAAGGFHPGVATSTKVHKRRPRKS